MTTMMERHEANHDQGVQGPEAPRLDLLQVAPAAVRAQAALEGYVRSAGLDAKLLDLVRLRASFINGCAYCVDMHTKDARLAGETEQRLYAVPVWREVPFFTPRERAALWWTEVLTDLPRSGAPDSAWRALKEHFDDTEAAALTMAVVAINGWNRIAVGLRAPVGQYEAGSAARMHAAVSR